MIVLVEQYNAHRYSELIDEMFRLRARIFHDRLGWDVNVVDGKERDKFDDEAPVYLIYTDDRAREVKGSLRLLPTTGPTLLAEFFSDTCPDAIHLSAPTIWECTRFCLDDRIVDRGTPEEQLFTSAVMIAALGEFALKSGIESFVGNFEAPMIRLYRRIGCKIEILGSTSRFGQPVYLGLFPVYEPGLIRLRERLESAQFGRSQTREIAA